MSDKTISLTVLAQDAELVMDLVGMVLQSNHIGGEMRSSSGQTREITPSHYAGMDEVDQHIMDEFLDVAGILPIQCTAVTIHLRDDWDSMDLSELDQMGNADG